jgi:hypothetical protein
MAKHAASLAIDCSSTDGEADTMSHLLPSHFSQALPPGVHAVLFAPAPKTIVRQFMRTWLLEAAEAVCSEARSGRWYS